MLHSNKEHITIDYQEHNYCPVPVSEIEVLLLLQIDYINAFLTWVL